MNIKRMAESLAKKHFSRNPFEIIKGMNIILVYAPLIDIRGFYQYYQRNNVIYINEDISRHEQTLVCAHELGHMLLHKKSNTIFMDTHTQFNANKFEIEANTFAMDLLIGDEFLLEYHSFNTEQLARMLGYQEELIKLRLKEWQNL